MVESSDSELLFSVETPLGFPVRVTRTIWDLIVSMKHPVMAGKEEDVKETLLHPLELRLSRRDETVYLFYGAAHLGRWVCAVTKRLEEDGFLVTGYPTDSIKEGTNGPGKSIL